MFVFSKPVPRHAFVRLELQPFAYADTPLPSGYGKTISRPFMVALMTDLLDLQPTDVVLEIGTGLGYQAAVLAELALRVYSVELIDELADEARRRLHRQGYVNVDIRTGDGRAGWHEHAPFDKIVDGGARSRAAVTHLSAEAWRQDGHSCRPGRCAATAAGGKRRRRHRVDLGDPAGAVLTARTSRGRLNGVAAVSPGRTARRAGIAVAKRRCAPRRSQPL